jgi:hypothetical protein
MPTQIVLEQLREQVTDELTRRFESEKESLLSSHEEALQTMKATVTEELNTLHSLASDEADSRHLLATETALQDLKTTLSLAHAGEQDLNHSMRCAY